MLYKPACHFLFEHWTSISIRSHSCVCVCDIGKFLFIPQDGVKHSDGSNWCSESNLKIKGNNVNLYELFKQKIRERLYQKSNKK